MKPSLKFTVEAIGEFEVREELSTLQSARVNLRVSNYFGSEFTKLLKHRAEIGAALTQRVLEEAFASRAYESLTPEEQSQLDDLINTDKSDESGDYRQHNYQINWITWLFTFPEVCIKSPEGFNFEELVRSGQEPLLTKIWDEHLKATDEVRSKKKLSTESST